MRSALLPSRLRPRLHDVVRCATPGARAQPRRSRRPHARALMREPHVSSSTRRKLGDAGQRHPCHLATLVV